jgi:hypothetical protein
MMNQKGAQREDLPTGTEEKHKKPQPGYHYMDPCRQTKELLNTYTENPTLKFSYVNNGFGITNQGKWAPPH